MESTPGTNVFPLYYSQLRLVAESAAALQADTQFVFDGSMLISIPPGLTALDNQVVITARNPGRFPPNIVELQARLATDTQPGSPLLRINDADAVFWSDAAVQKFLVPYVASCGAHEAPELLQMLRDAWNLYPVDEVTVYALVHTVARMDEPLTLERVIHVVFAESGSDTLQQWSLERFLRTYRPTVYPGATLAQVPYWRGQAGTPQYPDYADLRAMAESAASLRLDRAYFVCPATAPARFEGPFRTLDANLDDGDIVIPVSNPAVPQFRPQLPGVWFTPGDGIEARNLSVTDESSPEWPVSADALFWSTGSVDQFLFPYYASTRGLNGLVQLNQIIESWRFDLDVPLPPDQPPIVFGDGDGVEVAALIHMPTSEWTRLEERVDTEVRVVFSDASGGTGIARAREFRVTRERGRRR